MLFGSPFFWYESTNIPKNSPTCLKNAQCQCEPKNPRGVDHNSAFGMSSGSDSLQKLSNGGMPQHDRRSPLTNSWWTKPWGKYIYVYTNYLGNICGYATICTILCILVGNPRKSWEVHVQQKYPSFPEMVQDVIILGETIPLPLNS